MALTIPNRFVNGQTVDAAKFNSNFDAISTWAGSTDTALTTAQSEVDAAEVDIANQGKGAFLAWSTANQSISATSYTVVEFDDTTTDAFDTDSYFASHIYTPLVAGAYQFNVSMWANGLIDAETLKVYITKNTTRHLLLEINGNTTNNGNSCGVSIILKSNGSTDTFKIEVYGSGACILDYRHFSGVCVKPD